MKLFKFSIETKLRGSTIKFETVNAPDARQAIEHVSGLYPVGPYEFVARLVKTVTV